MVVANLEDQQVDTTEQQIDDTVQQHQVNIIQGIFKSVEPPAPVIAQKDFQADDDEIQGRTDQQEYLFV